MKLLNQVKKKSNNNKQILILAAVVKLPQTVGLGDLKVSFVSYNFWEFFKLKKVKS